MNRTFFIIIYLLSCLSITAQQEYSVKQDETIESIARKFNTSVNELKRLNPDLEMWFTGLVLKVPQSATNTSGILHPDTNTGQTHDKIIMRDGSYILCKIAKSDARNIYFSQDGEEGTFDVAKKFIKEINYADGSKKKFTK